MKSRGDLSTENTPMQKLNLFISFSGGKTSAFMTKWLLRNKREDYGEIVILFANTGQEDERTLEFVNRCDKEWGLGVVWLEAVVDPIIGNGTMFNVVDFETANRDGRIYEDVIKKYGIPNQAYPHCNRELKLAPMEKYIDSIGWKKGSYETAIGIRADEMDRVSKYMVEKKLIYPLCEWIRVNKQMITDWWKMQPFNLELEEHLGNCTWCWKKSKRKLLTLCADRPEIFEFPLKMEELHGLAGSNIDGNKRVFFRQNTSTIKLMEASTQPFERFTGNDNWTNLDLFDPDMDGANGCSSGCEVY